MKTLCQLAIPFFMLAVLTSCLSTPKPGGSPKLTSTTVSTQATQPTEFVVPTHVAFSTQLVHLLRQSGLGIVSVQSSTYTAMFQSTDKAVWIDTDAGIVEAVFFANSAEVERIQITEQANKTTGRYLYTIQAPLPSLVHDQTIDAAFPLYFTVRNDMLLITSSGEFNKTLRHIFSEQ